MKLPHYVAKISYIIIIFLFVGVSFSFAQSAKELQESIQDKTAELQKLEEDAIRIKDEISKTSTEKATLNRELSLINSERKSLENNIAQTRNKIGTLDTEIVATELQINAHTSTIIEQSKFLESLLRLVNQRESFSLLEHLLSLRSLSDFFSDRDRYLTLQKPILVYANDLRDNKIILSIDRQKLTTKQDVLETEKSILDDQKSIVVTQENKKKNIIEETQNRESLYQQNLALTLAIIDKLDAEIRDFESKLQFILDRKSLPKKGSEVLVWPLDEILITQRFGKTVSSERLYVSGSHSGNDFRAATGTPVYAVADGVIIDTGNTDETCPRASFGKWIFIEHDIGLSSTYGHLSKINVSKNTKVKKGELIGYSGNTGHSTAPHLHLTVYATKGVNGEKGARITDRPSAACVGKTYSMPLAPTSAYLDPLAYLPKTDSSYFKHN